MSLLISDLQPATKVMYDPGMAQTLLAGVNSLSDHEMAENT